ncbi:ATPase [Morganella phage Mecenats66]|nr:ATPase [Morganella phage Mecenats66]
MQETKPLSVTHIRISSILGTESLDISPGKITEMSGRNESGKTSVLEAIKSITSGSHDVSLLRNGSDKGEIFLELSDGTSIKKTVTNDKTNLEVRDAKGKKVPRAASFITQLIDAISVNPIEFVTARSKDRAKIMLETMPLQIDIEEVKRRVGFDIELKGDPNSIEVVDEAIKIVYDERTGTNRAIKEKDSTINQIKNALPPVPENMDGKTAMGEAEIRQQIEANEKALADEQKSIAARKEELRAGAEKKKAELRTELQKQIDELKEKATEQAAAIDKALNEHLEKGNQRELWFVNDCTKKNDPLKTSLALIVSNRELFAKREANVKTIKEMEKEAAQLQRDAEKQTEAIQSLNDYKTQLLESMPIKGLSVVNGDIFYNGVIFDRLNTQKQVELAIEIALLRAKDLGIMCVDGLELMDTEKYTLLTDKLREHDIQFFTTRVNDGDFQIINR